MVVGDDDKAEGKETISSLKAKEIETKLETTVGLFANQVKKMGPNDIVIADNNFEGVNSLSDANHAEIDTSGGTLVGYKMITEFCEKEGVNPGLRILYSKYKIEERFKRKFAIDRKNGINIYGLRKTSDHDRLELRNIIEKFKRQAFVRFVGAKFSYVKSLMDDWNLNDHEKSVLFGISNLDDAFYKAASAGTDSRDVESRCDLINRIKMNLESIYGGDDPEQEALWLRTPIKPLGGVSPIEYLGDGYQDILADLVWRMEGR